MFIEGSWSSACAAKVYVSQRLMIDKGSSAYQFGIMFKWYKSICKVTNGQVESMKNTQMVVTDK